MKMGILCLLLNACLLTTASAQTTIEKHIPVQTGQTIEMRFDYPNLIKVSSWDSNEVMISGTVSINHGDNDSAFVLDVKNVGNALTIRNNIHDFNKLPHYTTVRTGSKEITFKTPAEFQKFKQQNGGQYESVSTGVDVDIVLDIKLPKNATVKIESVYGMVEVTHYNGPLSVDATYGGVDAALDAKMVGELIAETNYGDILSNLDVKFTSSMKHEEDFHTLVAATPGHGPKYFFGSKYGKVYLRKSL